MGWCIIDEADLQKLRDKVKSLQKEIEELKREKYKSIKDKRDCPLYLPPRHTCETCLTKKEGNCPLPKFKMKSRTGVAIPKSLINKLY